MIKIVETLKSLARETSNFQHQQKVSIYRLLHKNNKKT